MGGAHPLPREQLPPCGGCPYLGRRLLASHQFHGATVAQEQVFCLVSSSLFLMECWVAILQEGWASCTHR